VKFPSARVCSLFSVVLANFVQWAHDAALIAAFPANRCINGRGKRCARSNFAHQSTLIGYCATASTYLISISGWKIVKWAVVPIDYLLLLAFPFPIVKCNHWLIRNSTARLISCCILCFSTAIMSNDAEKRGTKNLLGRVKNKIKSALQYMKISSWMTQSFFF
jgi:hypothetical protein